MANKHKLLLNQIPRAELMASKARDELVHAHSLAAEQHPVLGIILRQLIAQQVAISDKLAEINAVMP